jgi:hypothetical protein
MEPVEPDLSLLESARWGIVPKLLVAFLCIFGAAMLYFSPPRAPRKLPPERPRPAAPQLYVTLAPAAGSEAPAAPVPEGWCCAGRQLSAASPAGCVAAKGTFFAAETEARSRCPGLPYSKAPSGSPRGRGKGA